MSATGEPNIPSTEKQSAKNANGSRQTQRQPQVLTDGTPQNVLPPLPHELTAEWTVRAQLTFARAGEKVQREFSSNDPVNPVRVVYKWSAFDSPLPPDDDYDADEVDNSSSSPLHTKQHSFGSRGSSQSTPLKSAQHNRRWQQQTPHESFRSTTSSTNVGDFGGGDSAFSGSNTSKQRQRPYQQRQPRSASGGPNGVGGATTSAPLYGTRCRSTCNIVVSAVADFLPTDVATGAAAAASSSTTPNVNVMSGGCGDEGATATHVRATATDFMATDEADPFVFNTTASYTVLPQKSIDSLISTGSKNFSKVLALRDAFSQTSDTETKYFEEREYERRRYAINSRSPIDHRRAGEDRDELKERKPYEQRRATTERLLQTYGSHPSGDYFVDEANSLTPSYLTSPSHTFKSASMSRIPTMPQQARTQLQQQQQMLSSKQKSNSSEPLKKPRTVHIDVYCTGSEDEDGVEDAAEGDDADAEASASSDASYNEDGSKHHDLESSSTPQTVYDNEQMLLKHRRITGQALPRRLQQQQPIAQPKQTQQHPGDLNIGHAITKSSTAEEVSESKQLLFRKHIGDQRAAKLAALRQKYLRQPSDDALSSNYPNSSRSTVRDATCSSIASSIVTSSHAEFGDSSLKGNEDQDEMHSLTKSDSFEYENSQDRLRIKQMERFWQRTSSLDESTTLTASGHRQMLASSPVRAHTQIAGLQPISEVSPATQGRRQDLTLLSESENLSESSDVFYTYPGAMGSAHFMQRASPARLQQTSHFPRNRPGFLQFFGPSVSPSPQQQDVHSASQSPLLQDMPKPDLSPTHAHLIFAGKQSPQFQRWKSETRESVERSSPHPTTAAVAPAFQRSGSEAPPTTTSAETFQESSPMQTRRFDIRHDSPAVSEASTCYIGYTQEHLLKAKKFGAVVVAARKPGHHVGPTKNPNCSCESCQRWRAERFQVRSRAFSLGERPILRRPT
ncbi:serine-rich adhesin for platelets [Eurosta solidaginis]|uniref:serine-rich adhesin for platelets n=1 Tax=Eurosta solidaginis TaxID=178769 RepID=UPI003530E670